MLDPNPNPALLQRSIVAMIRILERRISEEVFPASTSVDRRRIRGMHLNLWMLYNLEEDINRSIRAQAIVADFSRDFTDMVLPVLRIVKFQGKEAGE